MADVKRKAVATVEPLFLGRVDAARALGVSARQVDYMVARGDLPVARIGRRVLFPYAELQRFAAELVGTAGDAAPDRPEKGA